MFKHPAHVIILVVVTLIVVAIAVTVVSRFAF